MRCLSATWLDMRVLRLGSASSWEGFLFTAAGRAAANNVGQHASFQFERVVRDLPIFVHESGRIAYADNLRILSEHCVGRTVHPLLKFQPRVVVDRLAAAPSIAPNRPLSNHHGGTDKREHPLHLFGSQNQAGKPPQFPRADRERYLQRKPDCPVSPAVMRRSPQASITQHFACECVDRPLRDGLSRDCDHTSRLHRHTLLYLQFLRLPISVDKKPDMVGVEITGPPRLSPAVRVQ